ncbi:hypothetical protein POM88_048227 [Heracleum sosnowskyi]|uniref:Ubiquitin-like protease family profile domain-containing protein n=1 Tax=Heracleum sosnowskyi TaxID=360622 RepID=A0AAD8GVS7_9APIA|nr:hypothetical protein POM88_048227 [Heracleum sosnowskyi]
MFPRIGTRSSNRLRSIPKTSALKGSTVRRRQISRTENKNCDAEEQLTTKCFDEYRSFVKDIYKSQKIKEFDVVSDFPFKVPKVPQQKDGVRCGHYVLYYIYKFIMSCPEHFNVDKDYPSFLDKNWFTYSEFETFCESLPSLVAQMLAEVEYIVFEPFDALRALVLYSPDSSQEKPNTVMPLVSCANNDTPEAVEEIPIERKNDKENSVSVITESDFQCQEKTTKRKLKIKAQEVRSRQKRRDHKKLEEKRKSPRLMTVNAKSNDETTTNSSGGKNKKASFTINDDGDNDFEETLPRKSPSKVRVTNVEEKPERKKRKKLVQFLYLDRIINDQIKVERSRPVYIAWKTSLIVKRNEVEM